MTDLMVYAKYMLQLCWCFMCCHIMLCRNYVTGQAALCVWNERDRSSVSILVIRGSVS